MHPLLYNFYIGHVHFYMPTMAAILAVALSVFILAFHLANPDLRRRPLSYVVFFGSVFLACAFCAKTGQIAIELLSPANAGRPWWQVAAGAGATVTAGLAGGLAAIALFAWKDPLRMMGWRVLDAMALSFPFAHAVGRIGCLFNGCCYGGVCAHDFPLGVTYPAEWIARAADPQLAFGPRYPVPLFEAAALLVLGAALVFVYRRAAARGAVAGLYMLGYALIRFCLEFLRADAIRGAWGGLSTGQWFSIGLAACGVAVLAVRRRFRSSTDDAVGLNGKPLSDVDLLDQPVRIEEAGAERNRGDADAK